MGVRRRVPPTSSSRRSWPSSSSWNGPAEASCARPRSRASATTNRPKRWCAKVAKETSVEVQIDGRTLKLTNLEKVLYPEVGFTKAQVIDYYTRIAPVLLPHTHDHPLTLKRYPNGVDGEFFYEKNCPKHRPEWVETAKVWSGGNNRDMYYCLAQDLPTLVWLGNLATLEMHTSLSLCSNLPEPRTLVFDLDPGPPATIVECCRIGLMLRDLFAEHGLECCAKTSGSKGLQLYVPLNTKVTYIETKVVSKGLAQYFEEKHPDLAVHKQLKELRTGRVLIDWSQNDQYKTTVNVYSLRARVRPTVSTPVSWDEVEKCFKAKDPSLLVFDSGQVLKRVEKLGDLFAPVIKKKQKLPKSLLQATRGAASGQQRDYFGNESLAERTLGLKDLDEGRAVRNQILSQFEASRWVDEAEERRALLTFVVVGGGPTGVEMAGAASELIRLVLRKDYRDLDINEARVVLIEAAPYVLVQFVPSLREAALRSLRRKGIEVMLGTKVDTVTDSAVILAGGEAINAYTVIWTAGVKASALTETIGVQLARQSRMKVGPTLQVAGPPEVFAIGDIAGPTDGGAPLPMLIPVAMQEGRYVAKAIRDALAYRELRPFQYRDPGIMATIGRNSAVAQLGRVHLSGFPGWVFWLAVHLVNVISFRSRLVVLVNWAWEYIFYDRPVRLIVRARK